MQYVQQVTAAEIPRVHRQDVTHGDDDVRAVVAADDGNGGGANETAVRDADAGVVPLPCRQRRSKLLLQQRVLRGSLLDQPDTGQVWLMIRPWHAGTGMHTKEAGGKEEADGLESTDRLQAR